MKRIVIAVTGSTGVIYGYKLLQACRKIEELETHVVISSSAEKICGMELKLNPDKLKELADFSYGEYDFAASIASGSFETEGMVIAPCSMKTLSAVASGYEQNLVARAAMVTLKERRRLVLLTRETPLSLIHLRNMVQVTEAGGIIMPPLPPLYFGSDSIDELADLTVGRVLNMFGIKTEHYREWGQD